MFFNKLSLSVFLAISLLLSQSLLPQPVFASPMSAAIERNDLATVSQLLQENKADANEEDDYGNTLLSDAASYGRTEIADLLLQHKAKVDQGDRYGHTPLGRAAWAGHLEMVKLLVSNGANVNNTGVESIQNFTASDLQSDVSLASVAEFHHLSSGNLAELKSKGYIQGSTSPLMEAADQGHPEVVKFLLDCGADAKLSHRRRGTALRMAYKTLEHRETFLATLGEESYWVKTTRQQIENLKKVIFILENHTSNTFNI